MGMGAGCSVAPQHGRCDQISLITANYLHMEIIMNSVFGLTHI